MKNFQKFFKKREDDTLDIQTLSTVSHAELSQLAIKLHAELKDAASIIETQEENLKQLKKDMSKSSEEAMLYKTHCEELQNLAQRLSVENDGLNTLIESKVQEIKYFREKNSELEKVCENAKNFPAMANELENVKLRNKEFQDRIMLLSSEKDLHRKEKNHYESEAKALKERFEDLGKKLQDSENLIKTKTEEFSKLKNDNKTLKNSLKQLENQKKDMEGVINGKNIRISELETNVSSLSSQLLTKTSQIESFESLSEKQTEAYKQTLKEKDQQIAFLQEKFETEIKTKIEASNSALHKSINEYRIKITALELERSKSFESISQLTNENSDLAKHLKTCQESLELANKKRELAKEEVLKLTQKLEHMPERVPVKPVHSINPAAPTNLAGDFKAVQVIKAQLDILYKALMDLMLSANTIRDNVTKVVKYQISSEEFSKFEKDLNKIVMNAHEAAENPNFVDAG